MLFASFFLLRDKQREERRGRFGRVTREFLPGEKFNRERRMKKRWCMNLRRCILLRNRIRH
jgi:hypothetical protein